MMKKNKIIYNKINLKIKHNFDINLKRKKSFLKYFIFKIFIFAFIILSLAFWLLFTYKICIFYEGAVFFGICIYFSLISRYRDYFSFIVLVGFYWFGIFNVLYFLCLILKFLHQFG